MRLELSVVLNHSVCAVLVCCIILNTAGYLVVMNKYSQMSWCCVQPNVRFHLFSSSSVVYLLCDFELPAFKVPSYWQISGQTCFSVQTGDWFSFYANKHLSPVEDFNTSHCTCLHLLFMSTVICFLSGLYPFLNPHILCSTLFSLLSPTPCSLLGVTISVSKKWFHYCLPLLTKA